MSRPTRVEILGALAMVDAHDVLIDDRAVVELGGHVVGGRADQLDPALVRAPVGVGARERGQERVVDVDRGHLDALQELAAEDLHVAREHEQIGPARQQLEHRRLGPGLAVLLGHHGHVVVGGAGGLGLCRADPRGLRSP